MKRKKKFVAIGKIGNNPDGTAICYKHWLKDIDQYLNKIAPKYKFRWINFYYNTGTHKGQQICSWTNSQGKIYPNLK